MGFSTTRQHLGAYPDTMTGFLGAFTTFFSENRHLGFNFFSHRIQNVGVLVPSDSLHAYGSGSLDITALSSRPFRWQEQSGGLQVAERGNGVIQLF